ncbi:MAG: NAD(P)-binding domain-containing protein [Myxococcota bacterium]
MTSLLREFNILQAVLLGFAVVGVLVIAGTLWSYVAQRRREKRDRIRLAKAEEAGLNLPSSLKPIIDPQLCSGCLSCLNVCPEGEVFGVREGKAIVIEASRCIGHGICVEACPTNAIGLVFGSRERGVEVPQTDENFETNRPGLHIVGELGGMGLLKNAVKQGLDVAQKLAQTLTESPAEKDVAIIGAGPAGIATSIGCRALGMSIRVIDQDTVGGTIYHYPRQKIVTVDYLTLPLRGRIESPTISKEELLEAFDHMLADAEVTVHEQVKALDIKGEDGDFHIVTSAGTFTAAKVVLATGRRGSPRKLGVPGEDQEKVTYSLIDPDQYVGKRVLVVGGGDSALEAANMLADAGVKTTICYRGAEIKRGRPANRDALEHNLRIGKLKCLLSTNVKAIEREHVVLDVDGKKARIENDYVIVCVGGTLPTDFLRKLGIEIEDRRGDAIVERDAVQEKRQRNIDWMNRVLGALGIVAIIALTVAGWNYYTMPREARLDAPMHELLKPSGLIGHGIGVLATLMMISNFLYSLRKRKGWFRSLSLPAWMSLHVFFGVFGCALTAYHSAFQSNNLLATATTIGLALVVVTGIVGRYIYGLVPSENGKMLNLATLKRRQTRLMTEMNMIAMGAQSPSKTQVLAHRATQIIPAKASLFAFFLRAPWNYIKYRAVIADYAHEFSNKKDYKAFKEKFLAQLKVRTQIIFYRSLRSLMAGWRIFHVFLAFILVVLIGAHIVVSLALGFGWIFF